MFHLISKLVWLVAQPLMAIALLAAFGALFTHMSWSLLLGRTMIGLAILAFLIGGLTNVGTLILQPLEARFNRVSKVTEIAGIIILGGGVDGRISENRGTIELNSSGERFVEIIALIDLYPDIPILITGGVGNLEQAGEGDGALAKKFVARYRLPHDRFMFETESRNTYQNATLSKPIANPLPNQTWLLVTSAFHMPRSVGIFHQLGWRVAPWPVDFKTRSDEAFAITPFGMSNNFQLLDIALHEWLGLAFYHWSGKTATFFPSQIEQ